MTYHRCRYKGVSEGAVKPGIGRCKATAEIEIDGKFYCKQHAPLVRPMGNWPENLPRVWNVAGQ